MTCRRRPVVGVCVVLTVFAAAWLGVGCGADARTVTVAAPPPGATPLEIGIVANTLDNQGEARRAEQRRVRSLGVGWIREELRWPSIEQTPGVYRWSTFDRLVADAARANLRVLPLLLGTPRWAGRSHLALPDDPVTFGAFAARAAARYGPGGAFWRSRPSLDSSLAPRWFELWNEPYTERYSTGGVEPGRYARMVRATLRQGRAANPQVRWLMAGELDYRTASGGHRDWLAALDAADPRLDVDVDGIAVHPYAFVAPDDREDVALRFRFDRTDAIAEGLTQRGAPATPLWITELGWSTCGLRPDCTSERDQAQRLADVAAALRRPPLAGRVQALFVYHLRDFAGRSGDDREAHYGLLRSDNSRKPAWGVVRALARQRTSVR